MTAAGCGRWFAGMVLGVMAAGWCAVGGAAEGFPDGMAVGPEGRIAIGRVTGDWFFFRPGWNGVRLDGRTFAPDAGFPQSGPGRLETAGRWTLGDADAGAFQTRIRFAADGADAVKYSAELASPAPVAGEAMTFMFVVPAGSRQTALVDGAEVAVPEKPGDVTTLFRSEKASSLTFDVGGKNLVVEGEFAVVIQDDRRWSPNIQFRLFPRPKDGATLSDLKRFSEARLDLTLRFAGHRGAPVDLAAAYNRDFADETADDGKGGWTDQGPGNDLSMLKADALAPLGVPFDLTRKPGSAGTCLVLSGNRNSLPAEAAATLPDDGGKPYRYLYLLHASAWTPPNGQPVGRIVFRQAGGAARVAKVVAGRDVGNWWQPSGLDNAGVAWVGRNAETHVGLYLSQFPLDGATGRVTFAAEGSDPLWMIVGAAVGDRPLALSTLESPLVLAPGDAWVPVDFAGSVAAGSPLDFSRYLDAPAGKHGPVTVDKDGHFAFRDAPDQRIRFFGPNLVGSANYLSKAAADDFAEKAARMGYNTVRFHHYEYGLSERDANDSTTLKPDALDQIHYLFAALKKRGIYLCLDLYASRRLRPGDDVAEAENAHNFEMKTLAPVSPSAMANWKLFARNLLTAKNPYTGMGMAEDPALFHLNLINENALSHYWARFPSAKPLYEKKYAEYLQARGEDTPENRADRSGRFIEFLNRLQAEAIAEQTRFVKGELGLAGLVTDLNNIEKYTLAEVRGQLDFVDLHAYWDHPTFPQNEWQLPHGYRHDSAIQRDAGVPRNLMPARLFGKPFAVTEYNYCAPNRWRVETAGLLGGYAGLQDWDALYRFAWSHSRDAMAAPAAPQGFDIVNDPSAQLAERIIRCLFVRGDVRAAGEAYAFVFTPELVRRVDRTGWEAGLYPDDFSRLGLYGRIGTQLGAAPVPGVKALDVMGGDWLPSLDPAARDALARLKAKGAIRSATGEIALDRDAKSLSVVTPRCEVFTFGGGDPRSGGVMDLKGGDVYQTVALASLDDLPLADSRSMLLVHLTNTGANRERFANNRMSVLESWGELPVLAERGRVEVALRLPGGVEVTALKADGTEHGPVAVASAGGVHRFVADTGSRPGGVLAYRVTR